MLAALAMPEVVIEKLFYYLPINEIYSLFDLVYFAHPVINIGPHSLVCRSDFGLSLLSVVLDLVIDTADYLRDNGTGATDGNK